jgi:hypothetical protein
VTVFSRLHGCCTSTPPSCSDGWEHLRCNPYWELPAGPRPTGASEPMIFVEFRVFVAHPLPSNPAEYDWDLPGPFVYLTFPVFLAWAVRERRRSQWHKRLMTFALFLSLGAAFQRFLWIPIAYGFGPFAAALDASLIVPMVAYDLTTLKGRLHPATVRGTLLLLTSEAVLFALWGTSVWRNFISSIAHWVHG